MPTVREFFAREAGENIERLERIVEGLDGGALLGGELVRVARSLRGSAQMAREEPFARVAWTLENVARALTENRVRWSPDLGARVRQTVRDLKDLLVAEPDAARPVVEAAVARFAAIPAPPATTGGKAPPAGSDAEHAFREFAARESGGVLAAVQAALQGIATDPRDREPLKQVLRRQRALMGSARLPTIPVLAETLTAIDEVTRLVARMDVAVTGEWLDVYGSAREVLAAAAGALQRGSEPATSPALERLRALRQQLVERFGVEEAPRQPPGIPAQDAAAIAAEAAAAAILVGRPGAATPPRSAAPASAAPAATSAGPTSPAVAAAPAPRSPDPAPSPAAPAFAAAAPGAADEPVPIDRFLLRGERALARALELRPALEQAVTSGQPQARELVAEVFDLIELART